MIENKGQKKVSSYIDQIFPPEDFPKYHIKKIIGKGSYGHVAKAIRKNTPGYVAIKKITNLFNSLPETRRILRQFILLKNCKHPNIVQLLDVIIPRTQNLENFSEVYLVTQFCDSDLQKVFKTDGNFFEIQHIRHISYQLMCGIKYLHSANIIHRDLKPANVLINSKGLTVKICDFGLSRSLNVEEQKQEDEDPSSEEEAQKPEQVKQVAKKEQEEKNTGKGRKKGLKRQGTGVQDISKEEEQKHEMRMKKQQQLNNPMVKLTLRVTTRWYRAPQLILLEKGYNKPIDIWSAGCIFGQLLKMQKCVCADSLQRFPLFPGKYCYPVSPNTLGVVYKNGYPQGRNDQLFMIISAIGKPNEEQMSFLTDEKAKDYIRKLETVQRKTFQQMFPKVDPFIIDLLKSTLKFNPGQRYTVEQILEHKLYEPIRQPKLEVARDPIKIGVQIQSQNLTMVELRNHFIKELSPYF